MCMDWRKDRRPAPERERKVNLVIKHTENLSQQHEWEVRDVHTLDEGKCHVISLGSGFYVAIHKWETDSDFRRHIVLLKRKGGEDKFWVAETYAHIHITYSVSRKDYTQLASIKSIKAKLKIMGMCRCITESFLRSENNETLEVSDTLRERERVKYRGEYCGL